jgi:7-cyano-7-deazaguanine synthase
LIQRKGYSVRALTFQFKGIANGELKAARAIARAAGARQRLVRLPDLREARDIKGSRFPGLPLTYIPMRNAVFYSLAASFAEEVRADCIVGGHNKDDLKVFRDVAPRFFSNLEKAFWAGSRILSERKTRILRPLSFKSKPEVIRLASSLGVPLGLTWSCHRDGAAHCWRCEGCLGRAGSFERAGIPDPLVKRS